MSKDSKIISVTFRDRTTIGRGNEWTIDDPHGYTVTEEGNFVVFTLILEHGPDAGAIEEVRVPRENVAQIVRRRPAPPKDKDADPKGAPKAASKDQP